MCSILEEREATRWFLDNWRDNVEERRRRERAAAIAKLYAQGLSMRKIGERLGNISRQSIHKTLTRHPDLYGEAKIKRREMEEEAKIKRREMEEAQREQELNAELLARMQRALEENLKCVVCDSWILKKTNTRTCSSSCARDYRKAKWAFSEDAYKRQRINNAKTILRRPKKYGQVRVAWAEKVLSGNDLGPNRRFTIPGSLPDRHPHARLVSFHPSSDSEVKTEAKG